MHRSIRNWSGRGRTSRLAAARSPRRADLHLGEDPPQEIIEDLKARQPEAGEKQLDLFADFNGIDTFDKNVDFYHHWSNRMILEDNLAEKEGLKPLNLPTFLQSLPVSVRGGGCV